MTDGFDSCFVICVKLPDDGASNRQKGKICYRSLSFRLFSEGPTRRQRFCVAEGATGSGSVRELSTARTVHPESFQTKYT